MRLVEDEFENFGFVLGQVGEYFTVEFDVGFFEAVDKAVVGDALHASGGADLNLPEAAEVTFLFSTVVKLVRPSMKQGFFSLAVLGTARPHKTLRVLKKIFSAFICLYSSFNSWHVSNLKLWFSYFAYRLHQAVNPRVCRGGHDPCL